jgi:mono/diheme cytochrome c family protein
MLTKIFLVISGMLCTLMLLSTAALGDDDKHRKRDHKKKSRPAGHEYSIPAEYKESCGNCHMAYPAGLLPEASWRKILNNANDHFGTELTLDETEKAHVSAYLSANAADRNGGKIGKKIMRYLDSHAPERISTLPYIQRKHRKIAPAVFSQPAVGGLQNCAACHRDAEKGDFDDDRAIIPQ